MATSSFDQEFVVRDKEKIDQLLDDLETAAPAVPSSKRERTIEEDNERAIRLLKRTSSR